MHRWTMPLHRDRLRWFFARRGNISVSVRNWADRVTYLVEAEVAETRDNELAGHTYPVIFGRSMNFTLPSAANGLTIEADVAGSPILFHSGRNSGCLGPFAGPRPDRRVRGSIDAS